MASTSRPHAVVIRLRLASDIIALRWTMAVLRMDPHASHCDGRGNTSTIPESSFLFIRIWSSETFHHFRRMRFHASVNIIQFSKRLSRIGVIGSALTVFNIAYLSDNANRKTLTRFYRRSSMECCQRTDRKLFWTGEHSRQGVARPLLVRQTFKGKTIAVFPDVDTALENLNHAQCYPMDRLTMMRAVRTGRPLWGFVLHEAAGRRRFKDEPLNMIWRRLRSDGLLGEPWRSDYEEFNTFMLQHGWGPTKTVRQFVQELPISENNYLLAPKYLSDKMNSDPLVNPAPVELYDQEENLFSSKGGTRTVRHVLRKRGNGLPQQEFDGTRSAAQWLKDNGYSHAAGLNTSGITECCSGHKDKCCGFEWEFVLVEEPRKAAHNPPHVNYVIVRTGDGLAEESFQRLSDAYEWLKRERPETCKDMRARGFRTLIEHGEKVGGFSWEFLNLPTPLRDEDKRKTVIRMGGGKSQERFETSDKAVEWLKQEGRQLGVSARAHLERACRTGDTYFGFQWRYAEDK